MAAAFHQAYFDPYDVHMSDLTTKEKNLKDFSVSWPAPEVFYEGDDDGYPD